jgi:hypothetical protein
MLIGSFPLHQTRYTAHAAYPVSTALHEIRASEYRIIR